MPLRYDDRRAASPISALVPEVCAAVVGVLHGVSVRRASSRELYIATARIDDGSGVCGLVLFGGPRNFGLLRDGAGIALHGAPRYDGGMLQFASPEWCVFREEDGPPRDWMRLHPVYSASSSITSRLQGRVIYDLLTRCALDASDGVPDDAREARGLPPLIDALRGLHIPASPEEAELCRRSLAYGELFAMQARLIASLSARRSASAASLAQGSELARTFVSSLPFELTGAQRRAVAEIARDLDAPRPMTRLLHGDVGSGKTVVAISAIARCVGAGHQAAVLVPTTILAEQFFRECDRWLSPLGVRCAELRGGMSKRARAELLDAAASGDIGVLIGTHALLEDDVRFRSLALIVVDEQHRFGVRQRDLLASRSGGTAHTLLMSATPIPRTLALALYGDTDITAVAERPATRRPVTTKAVSSNHIDELYAFIEGRAARGERTYWVCPAIDDAESSVDERASDIERRAPSLSVRRLHGAMSADEKRAAIASFASGETDLLVSTTVVEVGVDVPQATIMVVERATRFGLSTLHQLRGRVGRGSLPGLCVLLDGARELASSSKTRTMLSTDDGFALAEEDLRMRGEGDLAGTAQHGYMTFRAARFPQDSDLLEAAREDAVREDERRR